MIYYINIILIIVLSLFVPGFFAVENLKAILLSMFLICVMGIGVSFVIAAGEFDISTGALVSVAPVIFAVMMLHGAPIAACIAVGLIVTILIGTLSGYLTVYRKIPSFIATLGTSGICMGLSRIISGNSAIPISESPVMNVFGKSWKEIPSQIWWMAFLIIAGYILMHKTSFGSMVQCVGDNKVAAASYGINTKSIVTLSFVVCAIYMFFAGYMQMGYAACAAPGSAENYVLSAIVAPIIGGAPASGGKSNIIDTFLGAVFLTLITNVLFKFAIPTWYASVITGFIVIAVLSAAVLIKKRRAGMRLL
jgi:ribose/xylose/arabinose/galactoside ABC-type transport system permease subunit